MSTSKDDARKSVSKLVKRFADNQTDFLRPDYNETQARTDFISPLLEAFGWDVSNSSGKSRSERDVIEETRVEVEGENTKRPDYELRLVQQRKLFVEAKKPSVNIEASREAAFQTRRYGFSANLPISILTNFHQIVVFDCSVPPSEDDDSHVARLAFFNHKNFDSQFEALWGYFSKDTILSGDFDRRFNESLQGEGFDDYFLSQVKKWRALLAKDIFENSPSLSSEQLTFGVQLFICRIIFLRVCEDREIEKYETLKNCGGSYSNLLIILEKADAFYNSGIFQLINDETLGLKISDEVIGEIVEELYFPKSPYTFAVVSSNLLGEIYERFLGEQISIKDGQIAIIEKPEIAESGGVVTTPQHVVDKIVKEVLSDLASDSSEQLIEPKILDMCCGSGIFLISVFEAIMQHQLDHHMVSGCSNDFCFELHLGEYHLRYAEKRRILETCIRGVDVDHQAVEVAQFSLLLKLIENVHRSELDEYLEREGKQVLPDLSDTIKWGNSLLSEAEWEAVYGSEMNQSQRETITPFSWGDEFPEVEEGGFDAVVGNPPYLRIQKLQEYFPEEVSYYRSESSPFATANQDNFDKYALFVERGISLINNNGILGVIVPHKFMVTAAGESLRKVLTDSSALRSITHFGSKQVFGKKASNYTCILNYGGAEKPSIRFSFPNTIEEWRYDIDPEIIEIPHSDLGSEPWTFANEEVSSLFRKIREENPKTLGEVSKIFVGVQTSKDELYIIHPEREDRDFVYFHDFSGKSRKIERGVLKPCLHDVSLSAFEVPQPNSWMIFPYEITQTEKGSSRANLIQPEILESTYPECLKYFNDHRSVLESRNIVGGAADEKQFYQFGRSQSLTNFGKEKIILPILSTNFKYTLDKNDVVVTGGGNGPYYMIRSTSEEYSNQTLLCILNHPVGEAFVRSKTSVFRGGYYSHGKQYIENIPVPLASKLNEIDSKLDELMRSMKSEKDALLPKEKTAHGRRVRKYQKMISEMIWSAYGLTSEEEMSIIDAVPIPE